MLKHTFQAVKTPVVKQTVRKVSAVPSTGKKPPTLEEFDPLNPGEWQLGVRDYIFLCYLMFLSGFWFKAVRGLSNILVILRNKCEF